jgi:hypothetical protein
MSDAPDDPTAEPHVAAARRARLRLGPPLPAPGESAAVRNPEHARRSSSPRGGDGAARPSLRAVDPAPIPLRRPPFSPDDDPPRGAA